jgi:syntaxin 16
MATRERTALFLRYREEARALHGEPSRLRSRSRLPANGAPEAAAPPLPGPVKRARTGAQEPEWLFIYKDLVGDMAEVDKTLTRLSALYARHLLPSFGDGDHAALEADIRALAAELTRMLHGAESKVRHVGAAAEAGDEALVRRNVQKRFATQLQDLSMTFRRKQKDYLSELRGQREAVGDGSPTADGGIGVDASGSTGVLVDLGDSRSFGGTAFADAQLERVDDRSALAEGRAREIAKIAANINDLASIVKDLATLVVDQGTLLDRVDYNVEEVQATTKDAVRELRIADRYQRKRHAFWCIVFLAIGCGVMLCLLLLRWFG